MIAGRLVENALSLTHEKELTYLISGALPSEDVEIEERSRKAGTVFASVLYLKKKSADRIDPVCPYYDICGGCDFLIVNEERSAFYKTEIVKDNLRHIADVEKFNMLSPIYGSFNGYRHRCRFHVDVRKKEIGFLRKNSSSLVPISSCIALSPKLNEELAKKDNILKAAHQIMLEKGVNPKTHLVEVPAISNSDQVSFSDSEIDVLGYKVSANVFFQSNPALLPSMLSFVKENTAGNSVMDLYSGVGTFSRLFEGEDKKVFAVEREKRCLALSKKNAPSAMSITSDASLYLKKNQGHFDTVIVDPPRTGLDRTVIEALKAMRSNRIIYVSCSSVTASRDLKILLDVYSLSSCRLFDFYPGTSHTETVYVLDLK